MSVIGIAMVRDEADVIAGTLRHMADEVDELVVLDNGSADGTRDILSDLCDVLPLTVLDDPEIGYYQSRKMSQLAAKVAARDRDPIGTWIVPFDADEIWYGPRRIGDLLEETDATVAKAALYNHLPTAIDEADPDPFRSMVWRQREPGPLPKVAFRWQSGAVIHQGNHGVTLPLMVAKPLLEIRHFPARSAEQFTRKGLNGAAAYAHTDLPETEGAHWRGYGRLVEAHGPAVLGDVFRQHWWYLSPVDAGLIHDPAPYLRWRTDADGDR